jgi:hypothetical protein
VLPRARNANGRLLHFKVNPARAHHLRHLRKGRDEAQERSSTRPADHLVLAGLRVSGADVVGSVQEAKRPGRYLGATYSSLSCNEGSQPRGCSVIGPVTKGQLQPEIDACTADEWRTLRRQLNDIDEKLYQLRVAELERRR